MNLKKQCDVCRKKFDDFEGKYPLDLSNIGYGSQYDMCRIKGCICYECLDSMINALEERAKRGENKEMNFIIDVD